jgi:hypothetical protein
MMLPLVFEPNFFHKKKNWASLCEVRNCNQASSVLANAWKHRSWWRHMRMFTDTQRIKWTQSELLTFDYWADKKAFFLLCFVPRLFCIGYFWLKIWFHVWAGLDRILLSMLPSYLVWQTCSTVPGYWLRLGLMNFLLGLASSWNPPCLCFLSR